MPRLKTAPNFLEQLRSVLADALKANGIKATIETEPVPTTRLYRVWVVAPQFKEMKHSERQDLVWRIVQNAFSPEEQLRISMILTLTSREVEGK